MATFDTGEMHDPHRSTSPLLRLPAEIRHQIYDYVYPKHMLHVKRIMYHNRKNTGRYIAYWYGFTTCPPFPTNYRLTDALVGVLRRNMKDMPTSTVHVTHSKRLENTRLHCH